MDNLLSPRDRAIRMLNHKKPQHPPDIYFIRRNPDLFRMYRDPREFQKLKAEAPQCNKHMYELFDLDKTDQFCRYESGQSLAKSSKRTLTNRNDPYFTKYSASFQNKYDNIYETDKVLGIISPRDHGQLKDKTPHEIKDRSRQLLNIYCDRDNVYHPKFDENSKLNSPGAMLNNGMPLPSNLQQMFKPLRKHDKVRQIKQENAKL